MINRQLFCFELFFMIISKGLELEDRVIEREKFKTLVDYFVGNGALLDVHMDYNAAGVRGLYASRAFEQGDIVLSIPLDVIFVCEAPTDWKCLFEFAPIITKHIETNGNTKWSYWLDTVPSFEHFKETKVYFLPDEILEEFQPWLPVAKRELDFKQNFRRKIPKHGEYAWNLIITRALHYREPSGRPWTMLVGIMDLINHSMDGENVKGYFNGTHWMCSVLKPIVQGEELFLQYMRDDNNNNHEYVRTFAFYEENPKTKLSLLPKASCQQASRLFKKYNSIEYEEHRHKLRLLFKLYKERCGYFDAKMEL